MFITCHHKDTFVEAHTLARGSFLSPPTTKMFENNFP